MKKTFTHHSDGFILVLTLIILSIMVIMVTQLFNRGRVHLYFARTMIDREQAKQLALGGIQLAMNQLSVDVEGKEAKAEGQEEKKEKPDPNMLFLKKNLPFLTVWQEFTLTQDVDGIDGKVQFCITSEEGKINLNKIFDFKTKKFLNENSATDSYKKALTAIFGAAKKYLDNKDLFPAFEKFLKQRQYKVHDVTELLMSEEFQNAFKDKIFYEPPTSTKKEQRPVYLMDIFTLWSEQPTMNPWLLSDSIKALLGLQRLTTGAMQERENQIDQLLKNIKSVSGDLKTVWETSLEKLYSKEFKALPNDLTILLSTKFRAGLFSVLSYGTVGKITQKVLAIIEAQEPTKFIVKRLYWL